MQVGHPYKFHSILWLCSSTLSARVLLLFLHDLCGVVRLADCWMGRYTMKTRRKKWQAWPFRHSSFGNRKLKCYKILYKFFVRHRKGGTIYFHIYGTSGDLNTISQMLDFLVIVTRLVSEKSFHGTSEKKNVVQFSINWGKLGFFQTKCDKIVGFFFCIWLEENKIRFTCAGN